MIGTRGSSWGEAARREIEVAVTTSGGEEVEAGMTLSWAAGPELFAMHLTDRRLRGGREQRARHRDPPAGGDERAGRGRRSAMAVSASC